jgi:hypothetical protein
LAYPCILAYEMPKVSSLKNQSRTVQNAALLDQSSPKTRREIGKKIARHRMWQSDSLQGDRAQDGSRVVYRSCPTLNDFSGGLASPYRQVAFLDDHDVVVALDESLRVDIVRLPRYCPPSNDKGSPRPLGKALASKIEVAGSPCTKSNFSRLHSLRGGEGFALGLQNGEVRVYDTEYGSSTSMVHGTSFAPLRRRYHRDYEHNLSLARILRQFGGHSLRYKLLEVDDDPSTARNRPDALRPYYSAWSDGLWDFRETGAGLMAVHVDNERDCFSLRVLDNRLPTPALVSTALCVDANSKDDSTDRSEDITSVCFVSDYSLATSHNWGSHQMNSSVGAQNEVKIWDIRRLGHKSSEPAVESILPSFPGIDAHAMSTDDVFGVSSKSTAGGACFLLGANRETGKIAARFRTHGYRDEYQILDPSRGAIASRCSVPQSPSIHQSAVAPSHEFLALRSYANTIDFFDLCSFEREKTDRRGKKRSLDDKAPLDGSNDKPPGCFASFPASAIDQHGIASGVSCMAFNQSATALILGSTDGDLFLFRGV